LKNLKDLRLVDVIDQKAKELEKQGKKPTTVRVGHTCYKQIVKECRDELEKMRKRAAQLFKADWKNPLDQADEIMPIDSVFTRTGRLQFLIDDEIDPEEFLVEEH
jgi:hypothetical protein